MRQSSAKAAPTRRKIVTSSIAEFQRNGIEGGSIAGVMAAAGLTVGGFYGHFDSKAQLLSESLDLSLEQLIKRLELAATEEKPHAPMNFEAVISDYLSPDHRDRDSGCPLAGLGSELVRGDHHTRARVVLGFERLVALLSNTLEGRSSGELRARSVLTMCAMMGALTISRTAQGSELSSEVLSLVRHQLMQDIAGAR
jgi:TetR/AcrR family transcriptional repressor of nem operon